MCSHTGPITPSVSISSWPFHLLATTPAEIQPQPHLFSLSHLPGLSSLPPSHSCSNPGLSSLSCSNPGLSSLPTTQSCSNASFLYQPLTPTARPRIPASRPSPYAWPPIQQGPLSYIGHASWQPGPLVMPGHPPLQPVPLLSLSHPPLQSGPILPLSHPPLQPVPLLPLSHPPLQPASHLSK